jgi:hypothetical protein
MKAVQICKQLEMARISICAIFLFCSQSLIASEEPSKTIVDIANWKHPVHSVFQKNKIELTRVDFFKGGKYPVFFAKLTFDPTSSETDNFYNQLYYDVLQANGFWDYSINDYDDNLIIRVHWDKSSKTMTKTFEDTVEKKE